MPLLMAPSARVWHVAMEMPLLMAPSAGVWHVAMETPFPAALPLLHENASNVGELVKASPRLAVLQCRLTAAGKRQLLLRVWKRYWYQ